ncbi:MAG: chitobiase/beta-hexosaminidase C-terminal domain-containing protein, partial [Chitinivibrionales bacterium]|nr:chitobiase/beta-hexosaminidase C-terminal domain-containing protein [Chitinivibrionales bacterium]
INPVYEIRFAVDTMISLMSTNAAAVFYTLDGTQPDSSNHSAQRYSGPLEIDDETFLTAVAYAPGLKPFTSKYRYIPEKFETWIRASVLDSSCFGTDILVKLYTNADAIYYTIDGKTEPDIRNPNHKYTGAILCNADTVILKAKAVGDGFIPGSKRWSYFRKYVVVKASQTGTLFSDSIAVALSTYPKCPYAQIYYSLDGSTPSANSESTRLYLNNTLILRKSALLRAIAVAPNTVCSDTLSEKYIKTDPVEMAY